MCFSRQRFRDIVHKWYPSAFVMNNDGEERSQLLNTTSTFHTTCCEKVWIVVLALIFVVGVSAATYLLIVEGEDPVSDGFTLVTHKGWSHWTRCTNSSQLQLPVQRILLLPTNTTECWNKSDCLKALRSLQEDHIKRLNNTDILYNFVLAGDNRVYEGRGWNCSSSFDSNEAKVFTVAFLGKYNDRPPTTNQVKTLEVFLENAIVDNRISTCYQILTQDLTAPYITDMAFKLESSRKKNIC